MSLSSGIRVVLTIFSDNDEFGWQIHALTESGRCCQDGQSVTPLVERLRQ